MEFKKKKNGRGPKSIKSEIKKKLQSIPQKYKRMLRDCYKQLHANKMDNLEERYKFLDMYNLPRLSQEEIENMSRPIINNEIESVIKKKQKTLSKQKSRTRWLHR